jgi:murein L,D-transpeptidase YafK
MIMLRTCVLLCCSFLSFTVNADNAVPANVFSRVPANTVNFAPTSPVSRAPVMNTANRTPASTINFAPTNTVSRVPLGMVKAAPMAYNNSADSSMAHIEGIWLLIDTKAHKIEVKQGEQTLETLTGIAIGRRGAGLKHHRGDDITPYGNYRIGWVGEKSNFHKFFGLNYPSVQDAEIALKRGIISERNYYDIVAAHHLNQVPPQDTPLGGKIGIHGIGAGDKTVHQLFDWTHGCIALTNQQIDHLSQWLDTGTVVKIR